MFASAPVSSLQRICLPPIKMVSYHLFVSLSRFCWRPHRRITRLQKDKRFRRHRFRTGPARTGHRRVPFFGNRRICRLGIRLQNGSIGRIYCKKCHTQDIYAGDAFYHNTGNLFGTVGTCLVPHPFAAAYSYCYAAENFTACRGILAFPCLWHARHGPFLLRLT